MYVQYACPFPLLHPSLSELACLHTDHRSASHRPHGQSKNMSTGTALSCHDRSSSQCWTSTMCLQISVTLSTLYSWVQTDISVALRGLPASDTISQQPFCFPPLYQRSVICSGAHCSLSLTLAASAGMLLSECPPSERVNPELSWTCGLQLLGCWVCWVDVSLQISLGKWFQGCDSRSWCRFDH